MVGGVRGDRGWAPGPAPAHPLPSAPPPFSPPPSSHTFNVGQFRVNCESNLNQCWMNSGPIWTNLESILDHLCIKFDQFWRNFRPSLDQFRTNFGPIVNQFWINTGPALNQFRISCGSFSDQLLKSNLKLNLFKMISDIRVRGEMGGRTLGLGPAPPCPPPFFPSPPPSPHPPHPILIILGQC